MKNLSTLILVLGLALVGYAGWLYVGETSAAPDAAQAAAVNAAQNTAETPAPDSAPTLATAPPAPYPPALYITRERRDLEAEASDGSDYTPEVRDVTTLRIRNGLRLRRVGLYDGGQGEVARPVIILFHGAARDELSMIDMWDDVADANGLLLVSLKSADTRWDLGTDERPLIAAALTQAEATIPIDRDRMFLFGHSNGSIYAQFLAHRADGPWRAVATHAGTLPAEGMRLRDDGPPIRHYLGAYDHIFPMEEARAAALTLSEHGHRSELMVIPLHNHWFYNAGPRIARDAWAWFEVMAPAQ
ncbi:alpha/beta hydrolase [Gymnodinialimonas ulvae]|uniref:alpha/beta hydrolase n=1 Tax=Gymnodinialimonas ulvae TaxID=3126504 RepID=UPI0030AC17AD